MTVFFTADLHLGHQRVLDYAGRPFASTEEMNEAIITRWNNAVGTRDTVYVLGDLALCASERAREIVAQLHGTLHWIFGNHDRVLRRYAPLLKLFASTGDLMEVKHPDDTATASGGMRTLVLCHYAMRVWSKSHYGAWQLYGHSHGSLPDDPHALQLDVGVDCWDFTPVSFVRIAERMAAKVWRPVDGHGHCGPSIGI